VNTFEAAYDLECIGVPYIDFWFGTNLSGCNFLLSDFIYNKIKMVTIPSGWTSRHVISSSCLLNIFCVLLVESKTIANAAV